MADIDGAKRNIREAYDLLDQINKIMVLVGNDFQIRAEGIGVGMRLTPEKIKEVENQLDQAKRQLLGKINGLPSSLA